MGHDGSSKDLSLISEEEIDALEKDVRFHVSPHGAKLAWHEYGDPSGKPLFFFHGTGSHVHGMLLHKPALEYGFRIVAPDRPGISQSEFHQGWTPLDFAQDIASLADALGIGSFGIIGISGAGPSLMASAYSMPDRLRCVVDLACAMPLYGDPKMRSSLGTMDRFYANLGTSLPLWLFSIPFSLLGMTQKLMKSPKSFAKMFDSSLCDADKEIFSMPEFQLLLMRDFQELFRNGAKAPAYDAQTVYKDWGFELSKIEVRIEILQGSDDKFVPLKFSEYLASKAKDAHIDIIDGKGHFHHLAYGFETLRKVLELWKEA